MVTDSCQETIQTIESSQLHQMLEGEKEKIPLLIDVRQPQEYREGHIPGALLVPLGQLEYGHPSFSKEQTMVTYCRSGKRSMTAAAILCKMGYSQVMGLEGGILQWPYEQVSGPPHRTLAEEEVKLIRELFLFALIKEIETWYFYHEFRSGLKNTAIKKLFQFLEDMEMRHMEAMYSRYSKESRNVDAEADIPSLLSLQRKFQKASSQIKGDWNEVDDETAVLENAVLREYQKYDFYKLSADNMKDESLRVLLYQLALEERAHASLLLQMIGQVKEGAGNVF